MGIVGLKGTHSRVVLSAGDILALVSWP